MTETERTLDHWCGREMAAADDGPPGPEFFAGLGWEPLCQGGKFLHVGPRHRAVATLGTDGCWVLNWAVWGGAGGGDRVGSAELRLGNRATVRVVAVLMGVPAAAGMPADTAVMLGVPASSAAAVRVAAVAPPLLADDPDLLSATDGPRFGIGIPGVGE